MIAKDLFHAEIVETATGKIVYQSDATGLRHAERIEDGQNINLNHDKYHTRIRSADAVDADPEGKSS